MKIETEIIDKLFLELSQVTKATTKKEIKLIKAICWALGENGEFPERKTGEGAYWWRTELRRRAKTMKSRELVITIIIETDAKTKDLKKKHHWGYLDKNVKTFGIKRIWVKAL